MLLPTDYELVPFDMHSVGILADSRLLSFSSLRCPTSEFTAWYCKKQNWRPSTAERPANGPAVAYASLVDSSTTKRSVSTANFSKSKEMSGKDEASRPQRPESRVEATFLFTDRGESTGDSARSFTCNTFRFNTGFASPPRDNQAALLAPGLTELVLCLVFQFHNFGIWSLQSDQLIYGVRTNHIIWLCGTKLSPLRSILPCFQACLRL
ncbi:hypothetical protein V8C44DRAFT_113246 [Trichoderma aethiopicum]